MAPDRDQLIRSWLLRFALNASRQMDAATSEALVSLWCESFADLSDEVLESAFRHALGACRFFPSVADIRAHLDRADAQGLEIEAESAWERALDHARRWDGSRHAPVLPEKIERAVRAAGGLHWLESCPAGQLQWAQKKFIEVYKCSDELERAGQLVGRSEARRILAEARTTAEADRRSLPEPPKPPDDGDNSDLAGVRDALAEVVRKLPPAEERPVKGAGFKFPPDPNHERRVREQAARILAGARA